MRSITTISLPESVVLKLAATQEKRKITNVSAYISGLIEKDSDAYEQSKALENEEVKKQNSLNQQIHSILRSDPQLRDAAIDAQTRSSAEWREFRERLIKERGLKP